MVVQPLQNTRRMFLEAVFDTIDKYIAYLNKEEVKL